MEGSMQQTTVDGRYSLLRSLGSGGMGQVYLAQDEVLGREVALKVLWERLAESEEFVERFRREARSVAALSHPNIVSVYDQGRSEDGTYYIAMEHVSGGTLKERIVAEGPLDDREAADVAIHISEALGAAHEGGVIHRDIKPHNILLTDSGEVKVVDFGIARAVSQASMTGTSFILGTAHYLSPEQAKGEPTGPASDLYSLGVVLYEMLTGVAPYEAESPIAVALKHVSAPPASPRAANPDVSEGMDAVVTRLLAKDPADRHVDTDELVEDLRRVREGRPLAWTPSASKDEGDERLVSSSRIGQASSAAASGHAGGATWHRRRLRWLLPVALVALAAASLVTAFGGTGNFDTLYKVSGEPAKKQPVKNLTVPKVVGDKQETAERALREAGFKVTTEKKESKDKQKGRILSQNPGEGKKVERGSRVSLVVGEGPSLVETPDLHGLTISEAEKKLEKANLKLGEKKEAHSDSVPNGQVSGQSVRAGEKVEKGKAVDVTVSSGKKQTQPQESNAQAQESQPRQPVQKAPVPAQPAPAPQPVQKAPVPVQPSTAPQPVQKAPAPAPQPVQQGPAPAQPSTTAPQPAPVAAPSPPAQPSTTDQQPQVNKAPSVVSKTQPKTVVTPSQQQVPATPGVGAVPPAGGSAQPGVVNVAPVNPPKVVVPEVKVPQVQPFGGKTGGS